MQAGSSPFLAGRFCTNLRAFSCFFTKYPLTFTSLIFYCYNYKAHFQSFPLLLRSLPSTSLNNSCVRLLQLLDFAVSTLPPLPASVSPRGSTCPPSPFPAIHNLGVQKHYFPLYQTLHAVFSDVFLNWCPSSTPVTFTHLAPSRLIIPLSLTLFSIPLFHHLPPLPPSAAEPITF